MIITNTGKISIEIKGAAPKYKINYVKRNLKIIADYIEPCNKKIYIIAEIDTENNCVYVDIWTIIFNEEINIVITMDLYGNRNPMKIKCTTHTFSPFNTDFLKISSDNTIYFIDEKNWSPAISIGVMYIYFVNFFREYLDH